MDQHTVRRCRDGKVLIVGLGGLGSPAALWLARAGIGTLGLVDSDAVDRSNLNRQVIYRTSDIGRRKVLAAAERVRTVNSTVQVETFDQRLAPPAVVSLFQRFDFVIDATDQIASKYLVNDGAVLAGVAFSHAGVVGLQGQTMTVLPRRSACLRCLFPVPPREGEIASCQEAGIIGSIAGSIGMVQAVEAVKHLTGVGGRLTDRLLTYDAVTDRWRTVPLSRHRHCPLCGDRQTIHTVELVDSAESAGIDGPTPSGFR
jgi:molybdopterin-synthase adenylyltransferase